MNKLVSKLEKKSFEIRKRVLDICVKAKTGHVTSSMSCIDVLVALYYGGILRFDPKKPEWENRDRFILSKGQASPALYTVLADCGFYGCEELDKFAQKGGMFGVHLQYDVPGVEITSGSLGQAFGVAAGIALGAKMDKELFLTIALLGDGECYEGSIWETAMFAGHNRLNNFVAIVDRNYMCATDFTEDLLALEPMTDKWSAFGWEVKRINGHSFEQILESLSDIRSRRSDRPVVIIADTVKGEGIDCICNIPLWHGIAPEGEMAEMCKTVLKGRYIDLEEKNNDK